MVLVIASPHFQPRPKNTKGRPKSPPQFIIKAADGGYAVFLSLPKPEGKSSKSKDTRDNRYCCFLTPAEFEQVRGFDFPQMAEWTLAKIERRREAEDAGHGKLGALVSLITTLTAPPKGKAAAV